MQAHQRMLDPTANGLHSGESPLLRTVGLTKRYGDFLANDSIDIDIWPKEIHALLGENGAGKSTLVKAIYALIQPSKFLILDEPTAVLTPQDADQLFSVLERLKAEGRAILYISHKLEEVKRLCDT